MKSTCRASARDQHGRFHTSHVKNGRITSPKARFLVQTGQIGTSRRQSGDDSVDFLRPTYDALGFIRRTYETGVVRAETGRELCVRHGDGTATARRRHGDGTATGPGTRAQGTATARRRARAHGRKARRRNRRVARAKHQPHPATRDPRTRNRAASQSLRSSGAGLARNARHSNRS